MPGDLTMTTVTLRRSLIATAISLAGALAAAGIYTEAHRAPDQP